MRNNTTIPKTLKVEACGCKQVPATERDGEPSTWRTSTRWILCYDCNEELIDYEARQWASHSMNA